MRVTLGVDTSTFVSTSFSNYASMSYITSSPIRVTLGWVCKAHSNVMCEAARPISRTTVHNEIFKLFHSSITLVSLRFNIYKLLT